MFSGEFVNGIDMVDICIWSFTIFFIGLIFYLRREDRREGYPLECDTTGKLEDNAVVTYGNPKTVVLPHNRGKVTTPNKKRDTRKLAMARTAPWPGAPYQPTGDAMADGVGPASYAERADVPDLTDDGRNRIVPMRICKDMDVVTKTADPRGMPVYGGDGAKVGKVSDLWVDRSESYIRYLEVQLDGGKRVLLPIAFALVNQEKKRVNVDAIFAKHFPGVPTTKSPDAVTRLEEDKISGYYGGGKLYASPERSEAFA